LDNAPFGAPLSLYLPEARHLDGLRKWPRRGRFVFLFVTKRAQKTAPRERFSTSSLPAKGAKRRLRVK
jgi:hypothetical protein